MSRIQIAVVTLFATTLSAHAAAPREIAKIVKIAGDVFVVDANQRVIASAEAKPNRRQLAEGTSIFEKETIQTKDNGRIKIKFVGKENEIVLGGNSSLLMQEAGGTKDNVTLELKSGSVRSTVNTGYQSTDGYKVRTANAVAGVRGTVFTVNYDATHNSTTVATERGSVAVSSPQGGHPPVLVNAGSFSELKNNAQPTPPKPISENKKLAAELQSSHKEEDSGLKVDDSSKTPSSSGSSDKKEDKKDSAKSGGSSPEVALAPEPVKDDGRAPASDGSPAPASTPKLMGSSDSSSTAGAAALPFAKATNSLNNTKSVVDQVNQQQKQTTSGTANIKIPIK